MPTLWCWRINIIIPLGERVSKNILWSSIANDDAEGETWGVPLSADGMQPVTHLGISTAATEAMRVAIQETHAKEMLNAIISVDPHTADTWQTFLNDNGLQVCGREEA